jgi:16S rRNA (guanine(966)-N(2))-methyltransferase RsmD
MRIISGTFGGRKLKGKLPDSVRPTTDIARETLFNILNNIIDLESKSFLDLLAGSGIVGFEALSRGVSNVNFFDVNYKNIIQIKENIDIFGIGDKAEATKKNFKQTLKLEKKYDLIFADPPYDKHFYQEIIDLCENLNLLKKGGLLILEHRPKEVFTSNKFNLIKEREVGSSKFTIYQNNEPEFDGNV